MERLFGTDGIRAIAGEFPLDFFTVHSLGKSLISLLQELRLEPRVVIGRDTRESGEWLEAALYQGIAETKGQALSAGVIPTSAVSFLTRKHSFSAGIVISASHNPYQDNGIKIFSSQGTKIPDAWERKLEKAISQAPKKAERKKLKIKAQTSFGREYIDFLEDRFSHIRLPRKIKIAIDCSNGASSFFAERIFRDLGFEVLGSGNEPDGKNINERCGSLYPQNLARLVVENKADIGIAYDGDADRAIPIDENGKILNGDHTLFILSRYLKEKGRLKSDYVVATVMSNIGLEKSLEKLGLKLFRAQVGDKYVLEQMLNLNANLGGEQSGHTIFLDDFPTGDGILTSLKILEVMAANNTPLSKLVEEYQEFPQVLLNVRVKRRIDISQFPEIVDKMNEIKQKLGESGRLHVRFSGTEPLVRIMIEGQGRAEIEDYAQQVASLVAKQLG